MQFDLSPCFVDEKEVEKELSSTTIICFTLIPSSIKIKNEKTQITFP